MLVTNAETGTNICEVGDGLYRINTPLPIPGQEFSFNQYLLLADEPLLFHTGLRGLFPHVRDAVAAVMPVERLRHVAFSHVEADECGSLNLWLEAAPRAAPLCGAIAAMVSIGDLADRPPRALADGETVDLGGRNVRWLDAPHVPHGWECGYSTRSGPAPCSAAISSPSRAPAPSRSIETDISARARTSAGRWTIMRTPRTRARSWRRSPRPSRRRSPACTAAPGAAKAAT